MHPECGLNMSGRYPFCLIKRRMVPSLRPRLILNPFTYRSDPALCRIYRGSSTKTSSTLLSNVRLGGSVPSDLPIASQVVQAWSYRSYSSSLGRISPATDQAEFLLKSLRAFVRWILCHILGRFLLLWYILSLLQEKTVTMAADLWSKEDHPEAESDENKHVSNEGATGARDASPEQRFRIIMSKQDPFMAGRSSRLLRWMVVRELPLRARRAKAEIEEVFENVRKWEDIVRNRGDLEDLRRAGTAHWLPHSVTDDVNRLLAE